MAPAALQGPSLFRHPLAAAVVAEVAERGFEAAAITEITARAGVAKEEFDRLFIDKDDAVLRVFEAYIDDFERRVKRAFDSAPAWPDNLRAAAYALVRWIRRHPDATRFGMVEVLGAGEMVRLRREEVFIWCAALIDAGRAAAPDPEAVPQAAALIAVGAVVEVLNRDGQGTLEGDLVELVAQIMYGAVRPYLGEELARRELEIPPPADLRPPPDPGAWR
jgi:AcrR family transcriptional regulator